MEDVRMEDVLAAVDVFDETFDTTSESEIFLLAGALVDEPDAHAVVEEGQFSQALRQDVVVVFDVAENLCVGQEMYLRAAPLGLADDLEWSDFDTVM